MRASVLPADDEAAALVPTPDSLLWRRAGDARLMVTAGYALMLQVGHPTVAAGVREHSTYATDPWGRLFRTLDYMYVMVYGGARAAAETGRRLREMHAAIRGVAPDGRRYHALEPEAFAWVHATLFDATVRGHERFGRPLQAWETEGMYREWRDLGRLIGVRDEDLPGWSGFVRYMERMIDDRLEDSDVVHGVLEALARPAPPPIRLLPGGAWRAARVPFGRMFTLATVGLLPGRLRARLGLRFSRAEELELRALARASRAVGPIMPGPLRTVGPTYLHWRRRAAAGRPPDPRSPAAPALARPA